MIRFKLLIVIAWLYDFTHTHTHTHTHAYCFDLINITNTNQLLYNMNQSKFKSVEIDGLPPSFFAHNREMLFKNLKNKLTNYEKYSCLILEGGVETPRFDTDVVNFHFLQESNFYYLTGVREPDFYAIIDICSEQITLFWKVPAESVKIWSYVPSLDDLSNKYGVVVKDYKYFYDFLFNLNPLKLYLLTGQNSDSLLRIKPATLNFPKEYNYFSKLIDDTELFYEVLADTRTRKSLLEIEILSFIADLTSEAHISVISNMKRMIWNERDIESHFFEYISKNYYTRHLSDNSKCGSGINSNKLNYKDNAIDIKTGDLVLINLGANIAGYCSNITSTVVFGGKFNQRQKDVYNIVLNANKTLRESIKVGVWWADMHILAELVILQGLQKIGLIVDGDLGSMLKDRMAYYFMPHGVGYLIGIDVHDVGGYLSFTPSRINEKGLKELRTVRYLEQGNVITVGPGIYFNEVLLKKGFNDEKVGRYFNKEVCETFFNFGGVRIEDNVVVTENGCITLTRSVPRSIEEIEELMKDS